MSGAHPRAKKACASLTAAAVAALFGNATIQWQLEKTPVCAPITVSSIFGKAISNFKSPHSVPPLSVHLVDDSTPGHH